MERTQLIIRPRWNTLHNRDARKSDTLVIIVGWCIDALGIVQCYLPEVDEDEERNDQRYNRYAEADEVDDTRNEAVVILQWSPHNASVNLIV